MSAPIITGVDAPPIFQPTKHVLDLVLIRDPSLDRPKVEFSGLLIRDPSLDRPKVEFSGLNHVDGLDAPT